MRPCGFGWHWICLRVKGVCQRHCGFLHRLLTFFAAWCTDLRIPAVVDQIVLQQVAVHHPRTLKHVLHRLAERTVFPTVVRGLRLEHYYDNIQKSYDARTRWRWACYSRESNVHQALQAVDRVTVNR